MAIESGESISKFSPSNRDLNMIHLLSNGAKINERTNGSLNGIDPGPVPRPERWIEWVNQPLSAAELDQIRHSVNRGMPTVQLVGFLVWRLSWVYAQA